jgi:tmRNA-binding protein
MEIALAKGKQLHDKKNSLKEKDIEREIDRHARSSKDFEDF